MDSISTARNFFINQQGLSPDQADMLVSKGMESYNQQMQPQSMMQMASGGIARLGYQMGGSPMGVQAMPMDTGQALQIPQQAPTNFSSAQSITANPLLNYGQTQLAQGGATPLTMRSGGIARLGYESGGVTIPSQGSEMSQLGQMDPAQAVEVITKLLIENGVPPEQAKQLALQIIQIFAQGGAPAVEEFANQLEQQETQAMASGGIAGYGYRQGYFLGGIGKAISGVVKGVTGAVSGVVKGVANAVKSVVKSDIGKLALLAGGAYLMMNPGALSGIFGTTATTAAGAEAGGLGILGADIAAPGSYAATTGIPVSAAANTAASTVAADTFGSSTAQDILANQAASAGTNASGLTLQQLGTNQPQTFSDKIINYFKNPGETLMNIGSSAIDYARENPISTALTVSNLATLGAKLGMPRNENESDEDYAKRLQETQGYLTNYGRNLKITNPYFYQREGAVNPFAPTMPIENKSEGGIMGYRNNYGGAGMVSPRSEPNPMAERNDLAIQLFGKPIHQLTPAELDQLENFIREKFGKATTDGETAFAAKGGSMVPPARQIEGGILELDARKSGGYIPYGKKERVDDVPAMLAKDEFVFTSKAVKAAGGGNARRGAAKMYALMKKLEGARA